MFTQRRRPEVGSLKGRLCPRWLLIFIIHRSIGVVDENLVIDTRVHVIDGWEEKIFDLRRLLHIENDALYRYNYFGTLR